MTTSGDPLGRDEYPDRPDHPDFWKLSSAVLANDGAVEAGESLESVVGQHADFESVVYMAKHRAARAMGVNPSDPRLVTWVSMWLDAFTVGARYQRDKEEDHG
jgi:hypothetical protein